jgi:hypothetical protein
MLPRWVAWQKKKNPLVVYKLNHVFEFLVQGIGVVAGHMERAIYLLSMVLNAMVLVSKQHVMTLLCPGGASDGKAFYASHVYNLVQDLTNVFCHR